MTSSKVNRKAAQTTVTEVTEQEVLATPEPELIAEPSQVELSTTVEDELDDILTEEVPGLKVNVVTIKDAAYPWDKLLPSMKSLPKELFYIGDFSLLDTKIVSISLSALYDPNRPGRNGVVRSQSVEQKAAYAQAKAEYDAAKKDAKFIASRMAAKGATIMVESVRPHDMDIIGSALAAGGKVIVATPVNINHRNNAQLHTLQNYILDGRLLVISRTNTENFGKWNTREGDENHELMSAFASRCYIVRCAAQWQGTWIMAICGRRAEKDVFVKNTSNPLHQQLINQYGCKGFSFQASQE